MSLIRTTVCAIALSAGATAPQALAQMSFVTQERSVSTRAVAFNPDGTSVQDSDFAEADNFNLFARTLITEVTGPLDGSNASALGDQVSSMNSDRVFGSFVVETDVASGSQRSPAEAEASSSFLLIFNIAQATPIDFHGFARFTFDGRGNETKPSDLFGTARIRLVNADTEEIIAGIDLMESENPNAEDTFDFDGVLPAGRYALLGNIRTFAFSSALDGGEGFAHGGALFELNIVPAPSAAGALLLLGGLAAGRRRNS